MINFLRGLAIGIANVIPGVSGGTVALVLGIYQRLLDSISCIGLSTAKAIFKGKLAITEEFRRIDGVFLLTLGAGAGTAIIVTASLMTYLFANYHDPTYGFFFGLIVASIVVPWQMINRFGVKCFIACLIAIVVVVGMSMSMTGEEKVASERRKLEIKTRKLDMESSQPFVQADGIQVVSQKTEPRSKIFIFFAGVIGICAMILPGISGSFLLLLMGIYFDILIYINEFNLVPLAVFSLGAISGLLAFTRFLKYLMGRFQDETMSFLLGLVLGSLYAIWPFRRFEVVGEKRIDIENIIPENFGMNEGMTMLTFIIGCAIVIVFTIIERKNVSKKAKVKALSATS